MNIKEACDCACVLRAASPATQAALVSCGMLRRYQKGEHIFWDHTEVERVYFLVQGIAFLYKMNQHMDRKIIFIFRSGEMLGDAVLEGDLFSAHCEMLTDGMILSFPAGAMQQLMNQDAGLAQAFLQDLSLRISRLYRQLKNTGNMVHLDKQVVSKLWKLAKDHGTACPQGICLDFDLSIAFLADCVGSRRETVSRVIKKIVEKGWIKIDKNHFYICKPKELADFFKLP